MNITIAKHNGDVKPGQVYVGRTRRVGRMYQHALHALSNPYLVNSKTTRGSAVRAYRKWLWNKVRAADRDVIQALSTLTRVHDEHEQLVLVCHCVNTFDTSGNYCHAQVIARYLEYTNNKGDVCG